MAVKILQKTKKPESYTEAVLEADLAERVDAYGALEAEIAEGETKLKPKKKLLKELKESLTKEAEDTDIPAEEGTEFHGHHYDVEIGKRAMQVLHTDRDKLRATLGEDTFNELWSIAIGDIRKYCTPPQIAEILTEERTGARRVKAIKKD